MPEINYKTVTLSPGNHASPDVGACAMELASMIAGEKFTDRPHSVSPVIATFLRHYNDSLGDAKRQELRHLAVEVIDSRGTPDVEAARWRRLKEWTKENQSRFDQSGAWKVLPIVKAGFKQPRPGGMEYSAWEAVHTTKPHNDASHQAVVELIRELIDMGGKPAKTPPASNAPARAERKTATLGV